MTIKFPFDIFFGTDLLSVLIYPDLNNKIDESVSIRKLLKKKSIFDFHIYHLDKNYSANEKKKIK